MKKPICNHCGAVTPGAYDGMVCTECNTGTIVTQEDPQQQEYDRRAQSVFAKSSPRQVRRVHPVWFWIGGLVLLIGVLVTAAIRDPLGNARETLGALGLILLGVCVYLIPAVIAHQHRHPNAQAITVLNLFGGWTVLGWIAALVWAYTKPAR